MPLVSVFIVFTQATMSKSEDRPIVSSGESLLMNIPPPTALPSFITSQLTTPLPSTVESQNISSEQAAIKTEVSQNVRPMPQIIAGLSAKTETVSIDRKVSETAVTCQPLHPISSSANETSDLEESEGTNYGWIGWIRGTVQSVGNKVAEKAKTSMDTMITTLDPQMKDFINSGGDIDIIVASDKEVKISPVREAFQKVFGKATVSGFAGQSVSVAAQPVGFAAAVKSAEERINSVRNSGKIHPQQTVVSVENFIVEFGSEVWVELGLILLDDPWHDIILQTYTQTTPVPCEYVEEAKSSTPEDYKFKDTGFASTVGQIASKDLQVHHTMWQETLTGVSRRELILLAARTLAGLYQSRLPKDVI